MSLVCNECGKKFRNQAAAEFHASKTCVLAPSLSIVALQFADARDMPMPRARRVANTPTSPSPPRRSPP